MSAFFKHNTPTNSPIIYSGLNVGTSTFNMPIPIFWGTRRLSTNAMWFNNFKKKPANGKGKGGGGKSGQKAYNYSAAVAVGLCEGPLDSGTPIRNIWAQGSTTTTTTLSHLGMTLFLGTASQAPWSYVTTNYPAEARSYAYTAYLGSPNLSLGESATIPDNAFECVRTMGFAYVPVSNGWINPTTHVQDTNVKDVLLSDVILDWLTSTQYGFNFTSTDFTGLAAWATYLRAQGLAHSPLMNSQEKATSIIDRWAQETNTWIYWSGNQFRFVPLGDTAITANGVTYTPVQDVAYDLGLDDFLDKEQPVRVTRKDPADCFNRTVVNINDRTLGYIDNPVEWKDQTLVDDYGQRDNEVIQASDVCNPDVGRILVQLIGKRNAYIRNTYSFRTTYRYIRCLPGTIITLTEPNIGLDHFVVRVKGVQEGEDNSLTMTCEEFPIGIGTYNAPGGPLPVINPPTTPVQTIDPGNVNTPSIIEPNSTWTNNIPKLIISASGGPDWGGCEVNVSFDGVNYSIVGTIEAPAQQGLLTATLPSYGGTNPDTGHTLSVDCTESQATPTPVTNADAQALRTLSQVVAQPTLVSGAWVLPNNGEMLAFGAVAATGTYSANLTYLERGQYGSAASSHAIGDQFTLVDILGVTGSSIEYELPPQYIGQPIYIKLASFNSFSLALQDLSSVLEYQYTPTGAGYGSGTSGVPKQPTGFAVGAITTQVPLSWNANDPSDNVTTYTLWRAPGTGASFGSASPIWSGLALAHTDSSVSTSTGYTYFLTANNRLGASVPTAGINATTTASAGSSTTRLTASSSPLVLGTPPAINWYVDITNTSGVPLEVDLPSSSAGQRIIITDEGGNAGTNNFTIKSGASTIDTIGVNNGWSSVRQNGTNWLRSA